MNDVLLIGIVAGLGPVIPVAILSFVLHYFVALKSPPARRALWTAGIAYAITSVLITLSLPIEYAIFGPLAAAPAGGAAFLFWRADFRRDWFERADELPEGVELLDDDWRMGLLRLGLLILTVVALAVFRWMKSAAFS